MPRRMSSHDRLERLRAEAAVTEREKEEKRKAREAAKAAGGGTSRTPTKAAAAAPQRMKLVWGVGKFGHEPTQTFPYPQKAEAQAEAARLGPGYIVKPVKVPMEE